MFRYLIRRVLWAALLFVAVTLVTYVIFFLAPANPERLICGGERASTRCLEEARASLAIDRPVYVQYSKFLWKLVHPETSKVLGVPIPHPAFDLGESFITRQSVNGIVRKAAPVTAALVFGGAVLWLIVGISVGVFSALRPRSLIDRVAMVFVLVGISAHPVWIGYLFSYFFGFRLRWTPITGYCDLFNPGPEQCGGFTDWFHHMILPWATFMILNSALYVRMVRATVMETMSEDYVRTARAKGAPEHRVMSSHVLRNALLPVVTMLGLDIGLALGGAIFTETVYSLPGLGRIAVEAVNNYDLPIVQGIVVFSTTAIIFFNLLVDLLYAWIDPRIRLE